MEWMEYYNYNLLLGIAHYQVHVIVWSDDFWISNTNLTFLFLFIFLFCRITHILHLLFISLLFLYLSSIYWDLSVQKSFLYSLYIYHLPSITQVLFVWKCLKNLRCVWINENHVLSFPCIFTYTYNASCCVIYWVFHF